MFTTNKPITTRSEVFSEALSIWYKTMEFKIVVVVFNVAVLSINDGEASIINNDKVLISYFLLI